MKRILLLAILLLVPLRVAAQNITTTVCPGAGCVNFNTAGQGTIGIQVTGTWVGTITFQGTINNTDYVSISVTPSNSSTTTSTTTSNGVWTTAVAGLTQVRVVFTAHSSGTAVVQFRTTVTTKGVTGAGGGGGGVTSIGTTSPITGGTITTTGTIACSTCGVTGTGLQQFAATTSAQLAGVLSDELGSGKTLFSNDGTDGQVLTTNGAGVLSFADVVGSTTTIVNNIKFSNGKGVITDIHTNDTLPFKAYDVNDTTYRTFATLTAANTPSFDISAPAGGTVNVAATTLSVGGTSLTSNVATTQFGFTVDGAGSAITTGVKGFITVPFACTITKVTVLSTDASVTSGSIVIDIWKIAYASYPPSVANTITASAKPTLSSAIKSQDSTLTGWTTSVSAGDVLGFNVDSASTVTRVTLILQVTIG